MGDFCHREATTVIDTDCRLPWGGLFRVWEMNPMETFDVFPSTTVPLSEEIRDAEDGRGSNVISRIATCSSDRVRMDRALPLYLCTVLLLFRHSFSRDRTEIRNLQSFFAEEQAIGYWMKYIVKDKAPSSQYNPLLHLS